MCTNKTSLDLVTLMDLNEINEMKSLNDFVEIIYETPNGYKRDCYNRTELLKSVPSTWGETNTFWNDGNSENRIKGVYKLPYSGDFITEDSMRLLSLKHFNTFRKVECSNNAIGTYKFVSSIHGGSFSVCKLEPLVEVNEDDVDIKDQGILTVQLREIPQTIQEDSDELTENEQELIRQEQEIGDARMRDTTETEFEREQRHKYERERVLARINAAKEYRDENMPLKTHYYQRDRVIVESIENNGSLTLEQWLTQNNFPSHVYQKLSPTMQQVTDLRGNNKQDLILLGLSESDADMVLSKYYYDQIDFLDTFKFCYTAREFPGMPNRYYEKYCFDRALTPEEIFFQTPRNRIEYRGFHHAGGYHASETKLFVGDQTLFKISTDSFSYTFMLYNDANVYKTFVVKQNGSFVIGKIATLSKYYGDHPINQFTREQFLRTSALLFIILKDLETTPELLSLYKVLSMGLNKESFLSVYSSYLEEFFSKDTEQANITNLYNKILKFYKNVAVQSVLGEFDNNYFIIKNMMLILWLEYLPYNLIYNEDANDLNVMFNVIEKTHGASYLDKNKNNALNFILKNKNISAQEMINLLNVFNDSFNLEFQSEQNLYSTMISYSNPDLYVDLATFLFSKDLDPTVDVDELSILHRATLKGDKALALVQWLINKGADVNRIGRLEYIEANPIEMCGYLAHNKLIPKSANIVSALQNAGAEFIRTPYQTLIKNSEGEIENIVYNLVYIIVNIKTQEEYEFIREYIKYIPDINLTYRGFYNLLTAFLISKFFENIYKTNDPDVYTPIISEYVSGLDDKSFKFDQVDNKGNTPALFALLEKMPQDIVYIILGMDISVIEKHNNADVSILQKCIEFGDNYLEIVEAILETNVDEVFKFFTLADNSKTHAIKYAKSLIPQSSIYQLLLSCSVKNDFFIQVSQKDFPLGSEQFQSFFLDDDSAAIQNLLSVNLLKQNLLMMVLQAYVYSKFTSADFNEFKNLVNRYLEQGGDINYRDDTKYTILHSAVFYKYPVNVLAFLLSKGIIVNSVDDDISPLSLAERRNTNGDYADAIAYLESKGFERFERMQPANEIDEDDAEDEAYFRHIEEEQKGSEENEEDEEDEEEDDDEDEDEDDEEDEEEDEDEEEEGSPRSVRRRLFFGFQDLNRIKKYY